MGTRITEETFILMINISRACKDEENEKRFWKEKEQYANILSVSQDIGKTKKEQVSIELALFNQ